MSKIHFFAEYHGGKSLFIKKRMSAFLGTSSFFIFFAKNYSARTSLTAKPSKRPLEPAAPTIPELKITRWA